MNDTPTSGEAILRAALAGDLPFAEHLLTREVAASPAAPSARVGAAVIRALGYGDAVEARRLLATGTDAVPVVTPARQAATGLLALTLGRDELRRWAQDVDPAPSGDIPATPAAQTVAALLGLAADQESWPPNLAAAEPTGVIAGVLRDLDTGARLIRTTRWEGADDVLAGAADRAEAGGMRILARLADAQRALALAFCGDTERAAALARGVLADPGTRSLPGVAAAAWQAFLHLAVTRGDADEALLVLTGSADLELDDMIYPAGWLLDVADARSLPMARERVPQLLPRLLRSASRGASVAYAADYLAATAPGRTDRERLARLLRSARGRVAPYELARGLYRYGDVLREAGHLEEGRRAFAEAGAEFSLSGVAGWAARARAARDRLSETGPEPTFVAPLTEQEERIVELAARGLSNKEIGRQLFLSPRTIGGHLYNAFPKLGITSRSALRDALTLRERALARQLGSAS